MNETAHCSIDHNQIREDMDHQTEMLNEAETERLATRLNEKINIPFIREGTEQKVFVKTVRLFDRLLYKNLPNEIYGLVKSSHDGISDAEADLLLDTLTERLNRRLNIPYLPEKTEAKLFRLLLKMIVRAMRKGHSI